MHCNLCDEKMPNCDCTDAERRMHSENERLKEIVNGMEAAAETLGILYRNTDSGPNFIYLNELDAQRMFLTPAEREAIEVCIEDIRFEDVQATLRGLLDRTR